MKKILTLPLLLIACISFTQSTGQNKVKKVTTQTTSASSVIELIQGKWQSLDDKKNFLFFDKNERKEIGYGMKTWSSEKFELSNKCLNESDLEKGSESEKDKYITCKESDMCWYIESIDKDFLTLIYMARGNTHQYKRVK
jgi:hypothetical protein